MRQPCLFPNTPRVREKASPMAAKAEQYRRDNLEAATRALADPEKFGYLLEWAKLVLAKEKLESGSEAA
jgi:hypothetical protein